MLVARAKETRIADRLSGQAVATELLEDIGREVADMGTAASARAIEPLCILWCIPGLTGSGGWTHGFKLLTD